MLKIDESVVAHTTQWSGGNMRSIGHRLAIIEDLVAVLRQQPDKI